MNAIRAIGILLLIAWSAVGAGRSPQHIDPVKASPGNYRVLSENEHVRVVEYRILPGEKDEWHTHPPKVSYVVAGGSLRITKENGESFLVSEKADDAGWMGALGRHFAENVGSTPVHIVLIEIKSLAGEPFEEAGEPQ